MRRAKAEARAREAKAGRSRAAKKTDAKKKTAATQEDRREEDGREEDGRGDTTLGSEEGLGGRALPVSSIAEEVEVLRGTRSATFKDLLTHRAFARLLAAMTVSSLGRLGGVHRGDRDRRNDRRRNAVARRRRRDDRPDPAGLPVRSDRGGAGRPARPQAPDDRRRHRAGARCTLSMVFLHELWAIYLLSFVIECLSLLWGPARDASLPNLVPRRQLTNANSLVLLSSYATLPIGGAVFAALAAVSIWLGGASPPSPRSRSRSRCSLDAGTFLFSASMVAGIPIRTQPSHATERLTLSRVWHDTKDGISFLREDSIASAMTGGIVVAFGAVGAVLAIGPVFVQTTPSAPVPRVGGSW